ncbi:MAG: glycosyl hydrolase [Bacteroidota bacterium]
MISKQLYLLLSCALVAVILAIPNDGIAQRKKKKKSVEPVPQTLSFDESLYDGLEYRSIGPYRGGRSCAVTGVPGKPNLFYFGSTGGGVWRTMDGGQTWKNISDGFFGGSVGAVAVAQSDNNVIYVGGGEKTVRGNVSYGYGIWKSVDAGKTWSQMGLKDSRHISRIRIHPDNPDLVYAAVMGDLYKSSEERGIYRSKDGGQNWERIHFANADAGAVDLTFDPTNPRILYASTWRIRRTPYSLSSGGDGSDLWKSTDGGDNWEKLSDNKGFAKGPLGIIGVAVSPANPNRVWALAEAGEGGVFRSDDGGENWRKINSSRSLRQRAWYYTRIYADPADAEIVYVVNVAYHKSTDGGKTFKPYRAPHGDHHDLWIAPEDPSRMIIGDDGGAQVSFDGGENWSTYYNQPTSQFYRVTTDDHFPYRIYAAQQDNSTVRIMHRVDGGSISERHWESTAGGESAHIAPDPKDNDIVYGGSYGGFLTRINHRTNERRAVNVWPDNPMGYGAEGMKYRFQWNFPIFFSPHDKNKLYVASNHLHMSTNEGQSWEIISPDLTRNDSAKLVSSGGPITQDNTGVEYYCTIFAATESPLEEGLIWAGSDDGLLHVTKDGGKNWENVTPPDMPEWTMINSIDVDPFEKGSAYVAGTRYKLGDYTPYLYKTNDYGKTWIKIVNGIDENHFTRVLRADPKRKGLLYAGTETGMYISFDDGASWKPFQLNLPIVPITDLAIKNDNLVVATQGRSLWLIDDLTPLHQLSESVSSAKQHLYQPIDSYRMGRSSLRQPRTAGRNHPGGVMVHFLMNETPADSVEVSLSFHEADGDMINSFSTKAKEKNKKLKLEEGMNRFIWDMQFEGAKTFDGMILWWGQTSGPRAVPGEYIVKLTVGEESQQQKFQILADPRSTATAKDLQDQFDFLIGVRDKLTETHQAIIDMRDVKKQVSSFTDRVKDEEEWKDVVDAGKALIKKMGVVEKALYQTKNRSRQDPLNFPIRLNNKLAHLGALNAVGNFAPTEQSKNFMNEVSSAIDGELSKWEEIRAKDIPAFNQMVKEKQADVIMLPKKEEKNQ